jgi:hypothetical protein
MARREDLALNGLPAAHDIPHPFVGLARNADRDELSGAIEPGQVRGIPRVMLALHARPLRNERRGDHLARIAPLGERPVQDVARAARPVARAECRRAPRGPATVSARAGPVHARRRLRAFGQHRDGDGVLVHIHPEIDDRAQHEMTWVGLRVRHVGSSQVALVTPSQRVRTNPR